VSAAPWPRWPVNWGRHRHRDRRQPADARVRTHGVVSRAAIPRGRRAPWASEVNSVSLRNSSRSRPLKLSMKAFCNRLAGVDVVPVDLAVGSPGQDGVAGQLGAVVAADRRGLAVDGDQQVELTCHPLCPTARRRQSPPGSGGCRRRRSPGCESAGPLTNWSENEVEHPQPVRQGRQPASACECPKASFLRPRLLRTMSPLLAIQAEQPLVVHHEALATQEDQQTAVGSRTDGARGPAPTSRSRSFGS